MIFIAYKIVENKSCVGVVEAYCAVNVVNAVPLHKM